MSENKKTAFEEVFYAFLKRAMNNPSLLLTLRRSNLQFDLSSFPPKAAFSRVHLWRGLK